MSEIKERPILFNTEMVRAILEGRKTQTRRVVKPQPGLGHKDLLVWDGYSMSWRDRYSDQEFKCPYGKPGDRLWVRETFIDLTKTPVVGAGSEKYKDLKVWYRADNGREGMDVSGNWKPSIFMPRWACRILLEVTDVRVERVKDIIEWDARAEGLRYDDCNHIDPDGFTAKDRFETLWDSINEKRGYGWNVNPFNWAIAFKRVEV